MLQASSGNTSASVVSNATAPRDTRRAAMVAVIDLPQEPITKRSASVTGSLSVTERTPATPCATIVPPRITSAATPGRP